MQLARSPPWEVKRHLHSSYHGTIHHTEWCETWSSKRFVQDYRWKGGLMESGLNDIDAFRSHSNKDIHIMAGEIAKRPQAKHIPHQALIRLYHIGSRMYAHASKQKMASSGPCSSQTRSMWQVQSWSYWYPCQSCRFWKALWWIEVTQVGRSIQGLLKSYPQGWWHATHSWNLRRCCLSPLRGKEDYSHKNEWVIPWRKWRGWHHESEFHASQTYEVLDQTLG